MNAGELLRHYERVADAPEAIPLMRRFVLDLAVRGKLVPQDQSEEPASELVKRLTQERARLGIADRRKTSSPVIGVLANEQALPRGWVAIQGLQIFPTRSGNSKLIKGALYPKRADGLFPGYSAAGQDVWLDNWEHEGEAIILSAVGARCGKAFLASGKWSAVANTHIVWLFPSITVPRFAMLRLNNEAFWVRSGGAQPFIKVSETLERPFLLPPLAEQHRIVAKVDELMALCDRLEAARAEREAARDRLTAASLARLNMPDPDTFREDTHFVLEGLHPITTRSDQIKQLRLTVLALAVSGNLTRQDPIDGDGSAAVGALKKARAHWESAGRIRKEKTASAPVSEDEKYLVLPASWAWVRLVDVGQTQTGTSPSSSNPDFFGDFMPFLKPGDLDGNSITYSGPGLSELGVDNSRLAPAESVLMVCIGATLGKVNKTTRPACFNQQINAVTPFVDGVADYVAMAIKSQPFQALAWSRAGTGTLPIISKGKWEQLPIPLPPLAEQRRIVAKVDELMTVCDQLEASLLSADDHRRRLLESLLHEALARDAVHEDAT